MRCGWRQLALTPNGVYPTGCLRGVCRYDLLVSAAPPVERSVEGTAASAEAFLARARAAVVAAALPFARPRHLHLLNLAPGDLAPGQAAKVLSNAAQDESAAAAAATAADRRQGSQHTSGSGAAATPPELLAALAVAAGGACAEPPAAPRGKAAEVLAPGLFVVTHVENAVTAVSVGTLLFSGLEESRALPVFVTTSSFHAGKGGCDGDGFDDEGHYPCVRHTRKQHSEILDVFEPNPGATRPPC